MAMRELGALESVKLRDMWPHEAYDFTKWLSENLSRLEAHVGMKLELVQVEHRLPSGKSMDILAKDVNSGFEVVIENQLEPSDDDHFARLIGYAASRESEIASEVKFLIWVASDFSQWHLDMMIWLNRRGGKIYAIKVSVFRIGESYAPNFDVLVNPNDAANLAIDYTTGPKTIDGRFYPPLVDELKEEGFGPIGGRQGGWTGRWRCFRPKIVFGDAEVVYLLCLGHHNNGDKCSAGLVVQGTEQSNIYEAILAYKDELEESMGEVEVCWKPDKESKARGFEGIKNSFISVYSDPIPDETDESLEAARKRMKDTLISFRNAFQPKLEEIARSSR